MERNVQKDPKNKERLDALQRAKRILAESPLSVDKIQEFIQGNLGP